MNAQFEGLAYRLEDSSSALDGDGGKVCVLYEGERVKLTGTRYQDHNYLYPIPQKEIDLNPKLTQNPGY